MVKGKYPYAFVVNSLVRRRRITLYIIISLFFSFDNCPTPRHRLGTLLKTFFSSRIFRLYSLICQYIYFVIVNGFSFRYHSAFVFRERAHNVNVRSAWYARVHHGIFVFLRTFATALSCSYEIYLLLILHVYMFVSV